MRTKNLFKSLVAATLAVFSTSAFAQYTETVGGTEAAPAYETGTSDYVTIGSRVPYYVEADANIVALIHETPAAMNPSLFLWEFLDATNTALVNQPTITERGGAPLTKPAAPAGNGSYSTANEIAVTWVDNASINPLTEYHIRATEHSIPTDNTFANGCAGGQVLRSVYLIDRPTVEFNGSIAYTVPCGSFTLTNPFYVPLDVTGLENWTISYSLKINSAAFVPQADATGLTYATGAINDGNITTAPQIARTLGGTPTSATAGLPVTTSVYGRYEVQITNITDRISRKSMDMTLVAAQAGDLPAANYVFYIVPTPTTNPIQHRSNSAW